jgi:hypothetical protein
LGIPSEQHYLQTGGGVSACAVCDGFFYRNQEVVIVGAGDSACEEAHYLSKLCKKVTMLVRSEKFRASKIMEARVRKTENITILMNHDTVEVLGDGQVVTAVKAKNKTTGTIFDIPATGFFVAIGHKPNTDIFAVSMAVLSAMSQLSIQKVDERIQHGAFFEHDLKVHTALQKAFESLIHFKASERIESAELAIQCLQNLPSQAIPPPITNPYVSPKQDSKKEMLVDSTTLAIFNERSASQSIPSEIIELNVEAIDRQEIVDSLLFSISHKIKEHQKIIRNIFNLGSIVLPFDLGIICNTLS